MQSPTNVSRKTERSGMPAMKGPRSRLMQGQPFVRHTDSVNGASTQRKSGRKYETFVMTGDMIIRTTSGQNDSDAEAKCSVKNKQPPVDSVGAAGEGTAKKKKVDHVKSKIPKPSGVNSPKVSVKQLPRESTKQSPQLQSPKVSHKVVHSPKQSPKLPVKISQTMAREDSPKTSKKSVPLTEVDTEIVSLHNTKIPQSPVISSKHASAIPQKGSKLPKRGNVDNEESDIMHAHKSIPPAPAQADVKEQSSKTETTNPVHLTRENREHKESTNSADTDSDRLPFGYNNQAFINQYLAEKSSPFEDIKKPVYHTCAATPIELDIPPDDICSEDEQYTRISDDLDMEDLPPPPAELLEELQQKMDDSDNNREQNQSYFVPVYNNHFLDRGDVGTTCVLNSPQMSCQQKAFEEKSESVTPFSTERTINYSSAIQPFGTKTAMKGAVKDVLYSDHRNLNNTESGACDVVTNATTENSDAIVENLHSSNMSRVEVNTSNTVCDSKNWDHLYASSSADTNTAACSVLENELPDKSNSIISPENTACSSISDKGSINSSRIPQFINWQRDTTHFVERQIKNQSKQLQEHKCHSNNNNINESEAHLQACNESKNTHMLFASPEKNSAFQLDVHEILLDNVLESQTPMDASFNVPTPPGEKDNSHSDTGNAMLNKNMPVHSVNGVSQLDYVSEAGHGRKKEEVDGVSGENRESLAQMDEEPRRGMVVSVSGENFGYKTFPSKSSQCHASESSNNGRNQSPALVRSSKSHENYLDDNTITMIDIDFEDNIASSVDALHYDQSSTSLDNVNTRYGHITPQSKSLDNSPEKRYESSAEKVPKFFGMEKPRYLIEQREANMVVNNPKKGTLTSSDGTSRYHKSHSNSESLPPTGVKSAGSSPSHEFSPQAAKSQASTYHDDKRTKTTPTKATKKTRKSGGHSSGEKKNVSKSVGNSASCLPSPVKSPSHTKPPPSSHFDHSNNVTAKDSSTVLYTKTESTTQENMNFDSNVNDSNNCETSRNQNASNFEIQTLNSEPRSPRHTTIQETYSSGTSTVNCDTQVPPITNGEADRRVRSSSGSSPGKHQNQRDKSQINSNPKSPSKHKKQIGNSQSSGKLSPNDNESNNCEKSERKVTQGQPNYSPEQRVINNTQQVGEAQKPQSSQYLQTPNSSHKSESATRGQPPVAGGSQREAAVDLVGAGPSSPDSDTGSIYHQPLKEVDLPSAQRLAKRLFELEGFQKKDISKHLSKKNDFAQQVGEEFLKYFNFENEGLDVSLRKFLKHITLAGETQERERVLVHFSKRYIQCNPLSFNSEDAAHTLTCALLLLNTDLHGQNVGQKMSLGEFIENLSDLNDGENFPKEILKSMYHSIKTEALEWEFDEGSEGLTQDFDLIPAAGAAGAAAPRPSDQQKYLGHNPFLDVPDPNLITEYKKGFVMRKCCTDPDGRKTAIGKRGWKMFYGVLKDMILYLYKDEHAFKKRGAYDNMSNAIRVHHALATKATDYKKKQHVIRLETADCAEYLLQTSNPDECQAWIDTVNFVAALLSAPPLPGAVGSQKKFQRPLLPASYTRFNIKEQCQHHERRVLETERELQEHRKYPPEKGTKASIIQDYVEKEQYLQYELRRFKAYCFQLQSKLSAVTYPGDLEPSLVETAICEVNEPPSPNTQHKDSDLSPPAPKSPTKKTDKNKSSHNSRERKSRSSVGRSQSDRYSYRAAISSPYTHDCN